ncbi:unnamed protein product [Cercospora beticola]|nr:unnamed protein product [Cercospora beticola]
MIRQHLPEGLLRERQILSVLMGWLSLCACMMPLVELPRDRILHIASERQRGVGHHVWRCNLAICIARATDVAKLDRGCMLSSEQTVSGNDSDARAGIASCSALTIVSFRAVLIELVLDHHLNSEFC